MKNNPNFLFCVAMRMYPGLDIVDKFGENPDVDTGTKEDVCEFGGEVTYDIPGTDPIRYISCGLVGDTGQTIDVLGLDVYGNEVEQQIVTDGQNVVELATPLWRAYTMENRSATGLGLTGTLYCHTEAAPVAGVPALGNIRSIIDNGNNRTLNAFYTIPKGKVGFLLVGELGTSRAQTSGAAQCAYFSRRAGEEFTVKKRVDVSNSGSSYFRDERVVPDIIPQFTDIKLVVESVSANNMGVVGAFQILLVDEELLGKPLVDAIQPPTPFGFPS
jgi:hypothetical protein